MEHDTNPLGQPIGVALPDWRPPPRPGRTPMQGRCCRLEALDAGKHAASLHEANARDADHRMWTYLSYGPFASFEDYHTWVEHVSRGEDPLFFAIIDLAKDRAVGVASYLRIEPSAGSIEVGHLGFSPLLRRTLAATEAMFLMMDRAFSLGYRRYEWKCDALNAPSRAAAQRLGLSFEGIFRQAIVVKGRNRDTAWYAAIDSEWPLLRQAFRRWLDPANFDAQGRQQQRLSEWTGPILK